MVQVTLINKSSYPVFWQDDGRPHGFWQEPWYPSNLQPLKPGEQGTWRLESGGIMTGVEGWAYFKVPVPTNTDPQNAEYLTLWWERPYYGVFGKRIERPPESSTLRYSTALRELGFRDINPGDTFLELVPFGSFVPVTVPLTFANNAAGYWIWWVVELLNAGDSVRVPGRAASPLVTGNEFAYTTFIEATPAMVWAALIRPELTVKYWYDRRVESDWNVGSTIRFYQQDSGQLTESGRVIEVVPNRRLVFSIRPESGDEKHEEESRVSFTIDPHDGPTELNMVHDRLHNPRAAREFHEAWRRILASLKTTLESPGRSRDLDTETTPSRKPRKAPAKKK